jgi:hypothetical protein
MIAAATCTPGWLAAAPAMAAAQTDLRVTRTNCAGVSLTAMGLPASQLAARDKSPTNCGSAAEAAPTNLPRTGASAGPGLLAGGFLLVGGMLPGWRTRRTRRVRS